MQEENIRSRTEKADQANASSAEDEAKKRIKGRFGNVIAEMFGHGYDLDEIYNHLRTYFSDESKRIGLTPKGVEGVITDAFCPGFPNADWRTARVRLSTRMYKLDEALGIILERLEIDVAEEDGKYYMTYIAVPGRGGIEPVYASQKISKEEYEILDERL